MLQVDYYLWPLFGDHIGTLWIEIASFLVLLYLLNLLLYRPIRGILAKREEEKQTLEDSINEFQAGIAQNEKDIEEGSIQARKQGYSEKEAQKNSGHEKEHQILQEAISAAEEKMGLARKEIESKASEVKRSLEEQVTVFSNDLAEKILGRTIS